MKTFTDFSGHLPIKLDYEVEGKITLSKLEFLCLSSSSHMTIMDSERHASFMSKDVLEVLLGFNEVHASEHSSDFKSVFVVHTNITSLSFGGILGDSGLRTILFNHC